MRWLLIFFSSFRHLRIPFAFFSLSPILFLSLFLYTVLLLIFLVGCWRAWTFYRDAEQLACMLLILAMGLRSHDRDDWWDGGW